MASIVSSMDGGVVLVFSMFVCEFVSGFVLGWFCSCCRCFSFRCLLFVCDSDVVSCLLLFRLLCWILSDRMWFVFVVIFHLR